MGFAVEDQNGKYDKTGLGMRTVRLAVDTRKGRGSSEGVSTALMPVEEVEPVAARTVEARRMSFNPALQRSFPYFSGREGVSLTRAWPFLVLCLPVHSKGYGMDGCRCSPN